MIIAISGKAGSGKSTVGEIFEKRGFRIDSFATSVKDICSILFNFDREKIEGIKEEDRIWRETPDKSISKLLGKNFSPRDAMILIGTEIGRNIIHQDIWIKTLFDRYEKNKINLLIIYIHKSIFSTSFLNFNLIIFIINFTIPYYFILFIIQI